MSHRILISLALVTVQAVPLGRKLFACSGGYTLDSRFGNDYRLLRSPEGKFLIELRRALPKAKATFKAHAARYGDEKGTITQKSGYADLRSALVTAQIPKARREKTLKSYLTMRKYLRSYSEQFVSYRRRRKWLPEADRKLAKPPEFNSPKMPAGLPREFDLYLRGAIAWHKGEARAARQQWQAVIALPVKQRRHRSVWAAYMLGRSYVGKDAGQAVFWFSVTRKWASGSFTDSTGLAAASLGWQGRVELDRGYALAAIKLYVDQLATGDESAAASLRICARTLLKADKKKLDAAARDELTRRVLTAHLAAGASPLWIASKATGKGHVQTWLAALETAGVRNLPGAGRLGWAAYRTGLMPQAQRWVDRAAKDDFIACWIRAKLLLRRGKIDEAAAQLATALKTAHHVKRADQKERRHMARLARSLAEDLASLWLTRRQYVEALHLLATHGRYDAASYLTERVLTLDELIAYADAHVKDVRIEPIRNDLARRLVRAGRLKDARGYFSSYLLPGLDAYVTALRKGRDPKAGKAERAEALWSAAQTVRRRGYGLRGYRTGWYGAFHGGTFQRWREYPRVTKGNASTKIAPASKDEWRRVERNRPRPIEHWQYIYTALEHAWKACELMPDNDEKTARRLCEAGTWIKGDPKAADPFYKALVLRCGNTALGKKAARLHWLPKIETDWK